MTPRRPREGSSTSPQAGSPHGGRQMQNSPSENQSGQTIQDGDVVDEIVTTSEEIRRQKLPASADTVIFISVCFCKT